MVEVPGELAAPRGGWQVRGLQEVLQVVRLPMLHPMS